jgi:AcrR family transcriptional regulator
VSPADRVVEAPAPLGRRERKKLATRDRIFECAVALFASQGYDATTMEDIGECADVARATVFNYFARKEDVVLEWFVRNRPKLAEIVAEAKERTTDTASRLRQIVGGMARFYEDDPATGRAIMRAWLRAGGPLLPYTSEGTPAMLTDIIRSGQQQGDIPGELDANRAALVVWDAYLGVLYRWVSDEDGRFALEENLKDMLDMLLSGIARKPSVERTPKRSSKKPADH